MAKQDNNFRFDNQGMRRLQKQLGDAYSRFFNNNATQSSVKAEIEKEIEDLKKQILDLQTNFSR